MHIIFQMKNFLLSDMYALHKPGTYPNPARDTGDRRKVYLEQM